jgi:hypothetical protein
MRIKTKKHLTEYIQGMNKRHLKKFAPVKKKLLMLRAQRRGVMPYTFNGTQLLL